MKFRNCWIQMFKKWKKEDIGNLLLSISWLYFLMYWLHFQAISYKWWQKYPPARLHETFLSLALTRLIKQWEVFLCQKGIKLLSQRKVFLLIMILIHESIASISKGAKLYQFLWEHFPKEHLEESLISLLKLHLEVILDF